MTDEITEKKAAQDRARRDAVIGILIDWATWHRGYFLRLGYPGHSCGFCGGRTVTEDTASDDNAAADKTRNEIVDRCIDDLANPAHKAAINRCYLSAVYRMRDYDQALAEAHAALMVAFQKKGVLY